MLEAIISIEINASTVNIVDMDIHISALIKSLFSQLVHLISTPVQNFNMSLFLAKYFLEKLHLGHFVYDVFVVCL